MGLYQSLYERKTIHLGHGFAACTYDNRKTIATFSKAYAIDDWIMRHCLCLDDNETFYVITKSEVKELTETMMGAVADGDEGIDPIDVKVLEQIYLTEEAAEYIYTRSR